MVMVVVTDEKEIRKSVSGFRRIAEYVVAELEGNWAKTGKLLISGIDVECNQSSVDKMKREHV